MYLLSIGAVCQLQHPLPALFAPVKAAVTPSAAQIKPLPGQDVEAANAVASFQATPVKAAKGTRAKHNTILSMVMEVFDWKITSLIHF